MHLYRSHDGVGRAARLATVLCMTGAAFAQTAPSDETLPQLAARIAREATQAYEASPFSQFSKDYFARLTRDPDARPAEGEIEIDASWRIVPPESPAPVTSAMAEYLRDFFERSMGVTLATEVTGSAASKRIVLREHGGGVAGTPESFTITVTPDEITLAGADPNGLRDAIVLFVDRIGLRQAPYLSPGTNNYTPRVRVRLGTVPWLGTYRELIFMGYNAVWVSGGSLYAMSTSDAIPELRDRRVDGVLQQTAQEAERAHRYGLRTYCWIDTRQKFPENHLVFTAHPDIRGTRTWKPDGEFVLCTEHPLVQRWLSESIEGVFRTARHLDGIVIINGGEGFYHCFMRPFGASKGHTACPRCEKLGPDRVVSNLCATLTTAARRANPNAEVVVWPYSAEHVWSLDKDQAGMIRLMPEGSALLTEVEKDEYVTKPEGVRKHLWDYSIDLAVLGERAKRQIALCKSVGVPVHLKSECELSFEAPRLPFIPCHDRWLARAESIAASGATGAWMFPAFKPCHGSSVAEVFKYAWWKPAPDAETVLRRLADRIAGRTAGEHLRRAWQKVSEAIPFSPELPSYYTGPYYLGPAQPMCANPEATLPQVFYGRYLFLAEIEDAEGLKLRPTFNTSPTGNVAVFGRMYREMEARLREAAEHVTAGAAHVPERLRTLYESETLPIRWFYHTARTQANFYESCQLRDRVLELTKKADRTADEEAERSKLLARWREVLIDERDNARAALPVMQADMRLDFYFGGDHTFSHGEDMLAAKIRIIEQEIEEFLPSLTK